MMVLMAMALLRPLSVMLIFLHHFHIYGSNALLACFTASKLISFMQMQLLQFFLEAGLMPEKQSKYMAFIITSRPSQSNLIMNNCTITPIAVQTGLQ